MLPYPTSFSQYLVVSDTATSSHRLIISDGRNAIDSTVYPPTSAGSMTSHSCLRDFIILVIIIKHVGL